MIRYLQEMAKIISDYYISMVNIEGAGKVSRGLMFLPSACSRSTLLVNKIDIIISLQS